MIKNYSLNRLLVLLTTIGFFFFMVDSIIEHWDVLAKDIPAWIPVVFSIVGLAIGMATVLLWNEQWIKRMHILLLSTFIIAGVGFYYHIAEEDDEEESTEQQEPGQKEKEKPLLAPLSFAGLAAVGLLGTSRKWPSEQV